MTQLPKPQAKPVMTSSTTSFDSMRLLPEKSFRDFGSAYPYASVKIPHDLADHPLLEIDRLVELSRTLPVHCLEYQRGDIDVDQHDQRKLPKTGRTFEDTLRNIDSCGSWACLRNIEHDPEYKALLDWAIGSVQSAVCSATGKIYNPECYIVLASPHSITPFHFDPQHVLLLQIKGAKKLAVFPAADEEIVSPQQHEEYYHTGESNLVYNEEIAEPRANIFDFHAGQAVYIPVKSPHWVRNGPEVSLAINISWRSQMSDRRRQVCLVNRQLRKLGLNPGLAGKHPIADHAKSLAYRIHNRLAS